MMIAKSVTVVAFAMPLILSGNVTVPASAHGSQHKNVQAFSAYGSTTDNTVRVVVRSYAKNAGSDHFRQQGRSSEMPVVMEEQLDLEEFASEFEAWSDLSRSIAEESFEAQASAVRG